jgi:STAM-binding protein
MLKGDDPLIHDPKARIRRVAASVSDCDVQPGIPIRIYLRVGQTMNTMIQQHIKNSEIEAAFKLSTRFVTIFVEKLPKHPMYHTINADERVEWARRTRKILSNAEKMKSFLLEMYEKEADEWNERQKKLKLEKEKEEERLRLEAEAAALAKKQIADAVVEEKEQVTGPVIPTIDRSLKPVFPSQLEYYNTSNPYGWRPLLIPSSLMSQFTSLAASNTSRNIETCGVLCGGLKSDIFTISHVLIPKQSGTSDSCATSNEEEIFIYLDSENLITLGWIHTHPTQTAFLSSVDLHTHLSYQLMLPEAVAIVCAPKYQTTGFFSLTPNYGLQFIVNCQQPGFHPHPSDPPLFENSCHIEIRDDLPIIIKDLRQ